MDAADQADREKALFEQALDAASAAQGNPVKGIKVTADPETKD
jgi:hypothetical protein